jgi:type IV pilus biogenesis protein CpaD/CtpE
MEIKTLILASAAIGLSACAMHAPTKVTQNRIQVEQEKFVEDMDIRDVDAEYIRALGTHYSKHAQGPLYLSVAFDKDHSNAPKVSKTAAKLATMLRDEGVYDVQSNILPVAKLGLYERVIVSYTAYNALAPKDCSLMAGLDNSEVEADPEYKLGCSVETLFSQQIARPKDLAGGYEGEAINDGRRSANIVDKYRSGVQNKPLNGQGASE